MTIVYYDGNCIYCYNYVIWLIRHGLPKDIEFATIKGKIGQQFFEQYPQAKNKNSVIVQQGDTLLYESQAIIHLLLTLPNYHKLLGIVLWLVPKPLRNLGYRLFANNRNKMWKTIWQPPTSYDKSFFLDDNSKYKLTN
ncbi:thiol-disulfide oxidoreductase DCC family protein [Staphylococcus simiae]|uniref:Thiol-disulfide oxidoreductase n=1 Tax=Staphylococcus simiae CCM 7213 = CCUG 51256 TaxID=911238 RepID=G5JME9_9STAP|nr:DCC1-like thiol-disulfide oxidoreductase family protein [Staphylococcus simiae]EHJ06639.1 hypothetical protein SS7213T_13382 [Staphylococcus simiae CCM 7213 = CCUG 51256]PNZ11197.1 DUF393 domain-containing protein [Staphylococcus simiae]SNV77571.1 thiol-disulfide oxidoreductase [Staphylococcus simiae]